MSMAHSNLDTPQASASTIANNSAAAKTKANGSAKPIGNGSKSYNNVLKLSQSNVADSSSLAVDAATAAVGGSSKKKGLSKFSPFRVKIGSVVALRYQIEGNNLLLEQQPSDTSEPSRALTRPIFTAQDKYVSVWTDPVPGRDEGLALIGKRIRCSIPKMSEDQKLKVLEGEVVSLPDIIGTENKTTLASDRKQTMKIELLVDRKAHRALQFIKRVDEDVDIDKLTSEKAKRNYVTEQKIKGVDKVIVKIPKLAHPSFMDTSTTAIKWSILKRVSARLLRKETSKASPAIDRSNGENISNSVGGDDDDQSDYNKNQTENNANTPTNSRKRKRESSTTGVATKYVGDGFDSTERQVANWRWLASRFHDFVLFHKHADVDLYGPEVLSAGFIGVVYAIDTIKSSKSLATVTIKRFYLPEHTALGRMPFHDSRSIFEEFQDAHFAGNTFSSSYLIKIPIEELIVVSPKLHKGHIANYESNEYNDALTCSQSYLFRKNILQTTTSAKSCILVDETTTYCHRCRRILLDDVEGKVCDCKDCFLRSSGFENKCGWCKDCIEQLQFTKTSNGSTGCGLPCCVDVCDCRTCCEVKSSVIHKDTVKNYTTITNKASLNSCTGDLLLLAVNTVTNESITDYSLPQTYIDLDTCPKPLDKECRKKRIRTIMYSKGKGRKGEFNNANGVTNKEKNKRSLNGLKTGIEDEHVKSDICARMLPYSKKSRERLHLSIKLPVSYNNDIVQNIRSLKIDDAVDNEKDDRGSGRASRALQRSVMKDVFAIGTDSLNIDNLSKREPKLRFDRSKIHAWGVFAEEDILKGEMVIEYRGELISNAMAEKREKEYEAAKIGSDYMFRIDSGLVCDATKLGNVARFINASCDPNCRTKIIGFDGEKRIAIYAKRDIRAGEELCYDYKFPMEYDESKRIPCHCGAKECRGYMNWDKKYADIPASEFGTSSKKMGIRCTEDNEIALNISKGKCI